MLLPKHWQSPRKISKHPLATKHLELHLELHQVPGLIMQYVDAPPPKVTKFVIASTVLAPPPLPPTTTKPTYTQSLPHHYKQQPQNRKAQLIKAGLRAHHAHKPG